MTSMPPLTMPDQQVATMRSRANTSDSSATKTARVRQRAQTYTFHESRARSAEPAVGRGDNYDLGAEQDDVELPDVSRTGLRFVLRNTFLGLESVVDFDCDAHISMPVVHDKLDDGAASTCSDGAPSSHDSVTDVVVEGVPSDRAAVGPPGVFGALAAAPRILEPTAPPGSFHLASAGPPGSFAPPGTFSSLWSSQLWMVDAQTDMDVGFGASAMGPPGLFFNDSSCTRPSCAASSGSTAHTTSTVLSSSSAASTPRHTWELDEVLASESRERCESSLSGSSSVSWADMMDDGCAKQVNSASSKLTTIPPWRKKKPVSAQA